MTKGSKMFNNATTYGKCKSANIDGHIHGYSFDRMYIDDLQQNLADDPGATPPEKEGNLKKRKLKDSIDIHYRTTAKGRDYILRLIRDRGIKDTKGSQGHALSMAHRQMWFKDGWEKHHEHLIEKQRKAGIKDSEFK